MKEVNSLSSEEWQQETSKYNERLNRIQEWQPDLSVLVSRLPNIPLSYTPTPEGAVALQVSMFTAAGCIPFTYNSVAALLNLWHAGLFTMISLPGRLMYELWGSAHFAYQILSKMHKSGNTQSALSKSHQLMVGARSSLEVPWGEISSVKSIHVLDFVRSLADVYQEAENTYSFLCESCHPSYTQLMYWAMVGPPTANWSNPKFREKADRLIDRTLEAVEQSLNGIAIDARNTLELALPYIERDQH
jgi:hypothetical protein